ncbi:hypothetical protein CAL7716_058650 [Calothrix sp. PCC 7716]|nr:hypothetical protein CAL7716_058650 [Calothrix sp. PCC 7716]
MSLLPNNAIDDITKSVFWADCMVRTDLALGLIANENDYTSNLTSAIRRQINSKNRSSLRATSLVLKHKVEIEVGCDACIILSDTKKFKVCLFEAKLPRRSNKDYWDKSKRFSKQVQKQCSVSNQFAVWEMFYCDYALGKQPSWMNDKTSSCVWHSDAYAKVLSRDNSKTWTDAELEDLLTHVASQSSKLSTQIDHMVKEVCFCNKGQVFKGNQYSDILSDYDLPPEALIIEYSEANNLFFE